MPRWVLAGVVALAAVACAWQGLTHQSGSGGADSAISLPSTPLLSARRLPVAVGALVADERLAERLQTALTDPSMAATQACLEVAVGGSAVFVSDPNNTLIPASNLKLLTAYAVLDKLGATSHLSTTVGAAKPAANGVIDGPLYLVGGGDPLLSTAGYRSSQKDWTWSTEPITRLDDLADRVKAAGIREITGGVIGDDSRYDAERSLPTWKSSYLATGEIGPVGALVVDQGFASVGSHRAAANPAATAAATLATLLQARGITITTGPNAGVAPSGLTRIASVDSPPMSDIVGVMLRESDNLAAETLTKELGFRFGGHGTWPAGIQVIKDSIASAHVPTDGLVQVDGSGLDRSDRVSCHTLAALAQLPGPVAAVVDDSLPTAGDCGTLVKRFGNGPAAGRLRAKTGSLTGVAALTGYVTTSAPSSHPPCPPGAAAAAWNETFALLVNGVASDSAGSAIEDRIANVLASYPETPVLDPFSPLP